MRPSSVAVSLLLILALGAPAGARKEDPPLKEQERTLQQTRRQLRQEQARVAEARKKEASLLVELEAIDRRLAATRLKLAKLDRQIKKAETQIVTLGEEIKQLNRQRVGQENLLARRLRILYKLHAQGGLLPLALDHDDPLTRSVQFRHLSTLAALDARLIQEYRVTSVSLSDRKAEAEVRTRELSKLRAEEALGRAVVDKEAARRRVLLSKVREQRAYHERMVGELSEATRRLEVLIKDLQARSRRLTRAPSPGGMELPAVGFGMLRGRLPWPAAGRVVSTFGEQVHPRFGTRTFKNGIDIDAGEGTEIMAVYGGYVVYTGWFKGYGNLIILDHGNDYYTLYAHVADILVREGDEVRQGQAIGTVGDTGSLDGSRLHFEVRYQGRPQDPVAWLQHRG